MVVVRYGIPVVLVIVGIVILLAGGGSDTAVWHGHWPDERPRDG